MQRGSSFAGRLTKVLTGHAVMASGGQGPSGTSSPASQGPNAAAFEDDRHPVVDRRQDRVRGRGEDREGLERVRAVPSRGPALPQAGEGERPAVLHADQPGPLAGAVARPLVEPVRRHQAAARGERVPEGRLGPRRLGARVDRTGAGIRVPGPAGHETPAQHREPAALSVRAHRRHVLARRHVVAGLEVPRRPGEAEEQVGLVPGEGLREASAHGRVGLPFRSVLDDTWNATVPGTPYRRVTSGLPRSRRVEAGP